MIPSCQLSQLDRVILSLPSDPNPCWGEGCSVSPSISAWVHHVEVEFDVLAEARLIQIQAYLGFLKHC